MGTDSKSVRKQPLLERDLEADRDYIATGQDQTHMQRVSKVLENTKAVEEDDVLSNGGDGQARSIQKVVAEAAPVKDDASQPVVIVVSIVAVYILADVMKNVLDRLVLHDTGINPSYVTGVAGILHIILAFALTLFFNKMEGIRSIFNKQSLLQYMLPAGCFCLSQGVGLMVSQFIDAGTKKVLNQLRIPITAVVGRFVMNKGYTPLQWMAVIMISISALVFDKLRASPEESWQKGNKAGGDSFTAGFTCSLLCSFFACLGSVVSEKFLKKGGKVAPWIQKAQIELCQMCFNVCSTFIIYPYVFGKGWHLLTGDPAIYNGNSFMNYKTQLIAFNPTLPIAGVSNVDIKTFTEKTKTDNLKNAKDAFETTTAFKNLLEDLRTSGSAENHKALAELMSKQLDLPDAFPWVAGVESKKDKSKAVPALKKASMQAWEEAATKDGRIGNLVKEHLKAFQDMIKNEHTAELNVNGETKKYNLLEEYVTYRAALKKTIALPEADFKWETGYPFTRFLSSNSKSGTAESVTLSSVGLYNAFSENAAQDWNQDDFALHGKVFGVKGDQKSFGAKEVGYELDENDGKWYATVKKYQLDPDSKKLYLVKKSFKGHADYVFGSDKAEKAHEDVNAVFDHGADGDENRVDNHELLSCADSLTPSADMFNLIKTEQFVKCTYCGRIASKSDKDCKEVEVAVVIGPHGPGAMSRSGAVCDHRCKIDDATWNELYAVHWTKAYDRPVVIPSGLSADEEARQALFSGRVWEMTAPTNPFFGFNFLACVGLTATLLQSWMSMIVSKMLSTLWKNILSAVAMGLIIWVELLLTKTARQQSFLPLSNIALGTITVIVAALIFPLAPKPEAPKKPAPTAEQNVEMKNLNVEEQNKH